MYHDCLTKKNNGKAKQMKTIFIGRNCQSASKTEQVYR